MSQCTEIISSTNGYDVEITLELIRVVKPSNCPYGYNYNVEMEYDVSFNGSGPSSMYTLQAIINCGSHNLFVNIPNGQGNGTVVTTANPYNGDSDCNTATLLSLGCGNISLQINGPGISNRYINMDCTPASPLPIELAEFNAKTNTNNEVDVQWVTLSEVNNDYFSVEKSKDGSTWETVEVVNSIGNTNFKTEYNILDKKPYSGVSYYRLKQTDFDGSHTYSSIQSVTIQVNSMINHNQIGNQITLQGAVTTHDIQVYNVAGQNVTRNVSFEQFSNGLSIDIQNLKSGIYIIQTPGENFRVLKADH